MCSSQTFSFCLRGICSIWNLIWKFQMSFSDKHKIKKHMETKLKVTSSRSSCSQMFFKISVLKNFANFIGKHLCGSFFSINFWKQILCLTLPPTRYSPFPLKSTCVFFFFLRFLFIWADIFFIYISKEILYLSKHSWVISW